MTPKTFDPRYPIHAFKIIDDRSQQCLGCSNWTQWHTCDGTKRHHNCAVKHENGDVECCDNPECLKRAAAIKDDHGNFLVWSKPRRSFFALKPGERGKSGVVAE
jgi:hypothetical protein